MMDAPELKPCPFCGGSELYMPHGTDPAYIKCGGHGCGAQSGIPVEQTEEDALKLWNRRTSAHPVTVEMLENWLGTWMQSSSDGSEAETECHMEIRAAIAQMENAK